MEAPDFWNDPEVSQNKMKEVKSLKDDVATYAALSAQYDDIETMIEMGYEENDPELIPEIDQMMKEFVQTYEDIRMKTLLSGFSSLLLRVLHQHNPFLYLLNINF